MHLDNWYYLLGIKLVGFVRRRFGWKPNGERLERLKKIYVGKGEEDVYIFHYGKTCFLLFISLMAGLALATVYCLMPRESKLIEEYFLQRENVLGSSQEISLSAESEGEERDITVSVASQKYTKKELKVKFREAEDYINQQYLGENPSSEEINSPLQLIKEIPDSAIAVSWELGNDGIIQEDGSIANGVLEENYETEITAVLSYRKKEKRIAKPLTILPEEKSETELFWEKWKEQLISNQKESKSDAYLKLPETVQGKTVRYRERGMPAAYTAVGMALFLPVLVMLLLEERLRKELAKRERELHMDYPDFVEQFVLLVGAGLTIKSAWKRIAGDYEKSGREKHYVYEEMLVSVREMDNGMSEARAYELFGKRTGLLQYMKFCTLLVQNLRKGSDNLLHLLDYEVADAFRERKEHAKTLGEEAGTKLLMPMMLMLVIVFALILYAAFYNI